MFENSGGSLRIERNSLQLFYQYKGQRKTCLCQKLAV